MLKKSTPWIGVICSGLILCALALFLLGCQAVSVTESAPTAIATLLPTLIPTVDRLAQPPLPANPTQFEKGRYLYWLNCMACHGDKGQGLTGEFRSLYVEDQNCWGRGCHGGRVGDQGFPIPQHVPEIISPTGDLNKFTTADSLFGFLRATHPPQHPGILSDDQYWAISAYLLTENGRPPQGELPGPQK